MSITSSAVLVELNISVWTALKVDKEVTDTVISDNAAATNAAKVHKNLMAGTTLRKDIADYASNCRFWHNTRTLPWSDKGARLLPTSMFMNYKTEMNKKRDEFNAMVANFITQYPTLTSEASYNMGGLFNANDYPSPEAVASKFGFRLVFSPVPDAGDFRLDVSQQELAEIKAEYEGQFNDRLADAMRSPWEQLHKMLLGMSEKLTDREEGAKKKLYHNTFVTNAHEMCSMLTHLNVTNDPELEAARRQLETAMSGIDIDDIKESALIRDDVKTKVDAILKKYEW